MLYLLYKGGQCLIKGKLKYNEYLLEGFIESYSK